MSNRYCYRKPPFPKQGWGIAVFLHNQGEFANLTVLHPLFSSLEQVRSYIEEMLSLFPSTRNLKELGAYEDCILMPLVLAKTVPLKREYWLQPAVDFNVTVRDQAFLPFLDQHEGFLALVVPQIDEKRKWRFEIAAPFREDDKQGIEAFLKSSNYPTCEQASEVALYEPQVFKKLNWRTGKIGEPMSCKRTEATGKL